jgi:hypothetical protein
VAVWFVPVLLLRRSWSTVLGCLCAVLWGKKKGGFKERTFPPELPELRVGRAKSFAGTEGQLFWPKIPQTTNGHYHIKAVCRVAKVNKLSINHTNKYDVAMNVHH